MKSFKKSIDIKINDIFSLKKDINIKIKRFNIYINTISLIAIFLSMFYFMGVLLKYDNNFRYLFYSVVISFMLTALFSFLLVEMKIIQKYKIRYNPLIGALNKIKMSWVIILGIIEVIFTIIIPEISNSVDIIIIGIFLVFLIVFRLPNPTIKQNEDEFRTITILMYIFIYSLIFICLMYFSSFRNTWLLLLTYTFVCLILNILKDIIWTYRPKTNVFIGQLLGVILILMFLISLTVKSFPVIDDILSGKWIYDQPLAGKYIYQVPLIVESLNLPKDEELLDSAVSDNYYYIITKNINNNKATLNWYKISTGLLVKQIVYGEANLKFIEAQGHIYFVYNNGDLIQLYVINEDNIEPFASYNLKFADYTPVEIDGIYYLFPHFKFFASDESQGTPVELFNTDTKLDGTKFNSNTLYEDGDVLVVKVQYMNQYFVFDNASDYNSFIYSNGKLIWEKNVYNENDIGEGESNYLKLDVPFWGVDFYYYQNYFYVLDGFALAKIDSTGKIVGEFATKAKKIVSKDNFIYLPGVYPFNGNTFQKIDLNSDPFTQEYFYIFQSGNADTRTMFHSAAILCVSTLSLIFIKPKDLIYF